MLSGYKKKAKPPKPSSARISRIALDSRAWCGKRLKFRLGPATCPFLCKDDCTPSATQARFPLCRHGSHLEHSVALTVTKPPESQPHDDTLQGFLWIRFN